MLYYRILIFSSVGFMQTLRYGERHGGSVLGLVAVNYMIATIGVAMLALLRARGIGWDTSGIAIVGGMMTGTAYYLHLVILLAAFKRSGVGIVTAVNQSSSVVPSIVAWACWGEAMTGYRWLALAIIPAAMFLMRPVGKACEPMGFKAELLLIGCLLFAGLISTLFKAADVYLDATQKETYKITLFATASVWTGLTAVIRRIPLSRPDVATGVLLGVFNILALISILLALTVVPAVILYPTSGCLMLCLNVMLGCWIWKETLSKRQVLGLILAIGVVILAAI